MINNYEIKNVNNEEILYIYFNFDYELSSEDFQNIKENIEEKIKKYIYENKIIFKGTTILLISGTILFGSINIKKLNKQTEKPIETTILTKLEQTEEINTLENINEPKKINTLENIENKEPVIEVKKEKNIKENKQKETKQIETKSEIKKTDTLTQSEINSSKLEVNNEVSNINKEELKEEKKEEIKEVDNNIYINIKRKNGETIKLELEEYIIGVVAAEMPASFHVEALKSQAIIARTYALKAKNDGKTLTDNESTQSYKSNDELKSTWGSNYNTYYNKIKEAVISTNGMYITYNGKYIEAIYHSTSNGKTENAKEVWGNYYPYLISVESQYDIDNPSYIKEILVPYAEIIEKLGIEVNYESNIDILEKTSGDRVKTIKINDTIFEGVKFRNLLGLRSADFDIEKTETGIKFKTRGYGHGVGMSQYGANGFAKIGYTYNEILSHYYPNTKINKN